jgi:isoleucyl-tRNA synthetase
MTNDLSAYYLDYTKDILYILKEDDFERRSVQSTIYDILVGLLKLLTPIIPHTTSEAYWALPTAHLEDVYLEDMPEVYVHQNEALLEAFDRFYRIREVVLKKLEEAREQKVIGKSLQAKVDLVLPKEDIEAIHKLEVKLHQVLIVSSVHLKEGKELSVVVSLAEGITCDRCWNIVDHVHDNGLCDRCHDVVGGK